MATTDSQREAVQIVLGEFFVLTPEGWINKRADIEIDAMRDKQQKQRDKANKRWHKPEAEHGIAPAMPRHDETDATASKTDADAMPPTPTPTPTPVLNTRAVGPNLPDWLPKESWAGYVEMRRKIKKPMTDRAAQLRINDLEKFKDTGQDVAAILDQSTASSWTDLYPPKEKPRAAAQPTAQNWTARPDWVANAGFEDVADANASRCYAHNADQFHDGKRIGVTA